MKWNASLYDDKHNFVFEYGNSVAELLHPQRGECILDLGCGTGHLAAKIAEAGAIVTGIDSSSAMIEKAKQLYPQINFFVKDATDFKFDQPFDAVFSNATLHWILEPEKVIAQVSAALKKCGRFVAELGGKNNVSHIINAIRKILLLHGYNENAARKVWYFPSLAEYAALLEEAGFTVEFATYFDRETLLEDDNNGIADWINMFGDSFLKDINNEKRKALILEMQEAARPSCYKNGKWYADYKRLRFVAVK